MTKIQNRFEHLPCGILLRRAAEGGIPQGENL
jgi:hypothetical protein